MATTLEGGWLADPAWFLGDFEFGIGGVVSAEGAWHSSRVHRPGSGLLTTETLFMSILDHFTLAHALMSGRGRMMSFAL